MECPACDRNLVEAVLAQEDEFRGVSLRFRAPGLRCEGCGYETSSVGQAAEYNRALADAYRRHEGLLTSDQIRDARERLDMSQQDFADYLGVGIASVKRWEWGQVQEKSLDKLIRVLTDPDEAERSARRVRSLALGVGESVAAAVPASTTELWKEWTRVVPLGLPSSPQQLQERWRQAASRRSLVPLQFAQLDKSKHFQAWSDEDEALDRGITGLVS